MLLDKITCVEQLRKLKGDELITLSEEIREYIIDVICKNGGHLASSLGVVELTLALHYTFNTPDDRIIWDVGHQAYAHKIITGRKDLFDRIRKYNGLSGFPKTCESEFDCYNTGHSSTSLSLALGESIARDLKNENHNVIAVIGDGSLTGGMAFEALNQIGHLKKNLIIILNDNSHSISKNVGALSEHLTEVISSHQYNTLKKNYYTFMKKIPLIGKISANFFMKIEVGIKRLFVPSSIFEELGLRYFGPVDGHNIKKMIMLFENLKTMKSGPKIIHIVTKKGKGYHHSENDPTKFHGIPKFDKNTGETALKTGTNFSEVAGTSLVELAANDDKIIAITAAMAEGTGLKQFSLRYPSRFIDVGIAEQHAVTLAASLAKNGFKPFFAVYSTFLQRGYDQMVHDVALMNLPVRFLIDRSGIVGEDGETHHGLLDVAFIKSIPNFRLFAPSNGTELAELIKFSANNNSGPAAIRYPRGNIPENDFTVSSVFRKGDKFDPYRIKELVSGNETAIFTYGDMIVPAVKASELLRNEGISAAVYNVICLCPVDYRQYDDIINGVTSFIFIENSYSTGSISETVLSGLSGANRMKFISTVAFPNECICQGSQVQLFEHYRVNADKIKNSILDFLKK
ncbi:MAG: 1-deoxy-D-xylulose-5-phosphate synthase [Spirochaetes bacterium]|nr:1-deoxy-D-xylulose-5-phosphate synthase [Spirochaetota bacterium]